MIERATQQQQELFADYSVDREVLRELCRLLPALPSVLRYYDEFQDAVRFKGAKGLRPSDLPA